MATTVTMARVPFAPLQNPRLIQLSAMKNRQNGMIDNKVLGGKTSIDAKSTVITTPVTGKRALESSSCDDFSDGENVDPSVLASPSKKVKNSPFELPNKASFTFTVTPPTKPSLSRSSAASVDAKRFGTPVRTGLSSVRTPSTAPAGRSPPRKTAGVSKNRRSLAYGRIDPPVLSRPDDILPFSLDSALNSAMGASVHEPAVRPPKIIPRAWAFEIHEDTPDELAQNLMEHYAGILDLSSDDEHVRAAREDRGKENCPPPGYNAEAASRPRSASPPSSARTPAAAPTSSPRRAKKLLRRKLLKRGQVDDGKRLPLADLEADEFFEEGLNRQSYVLVDEARGEQADEEALLETQDESSLVMSSLPAGLVYPGAVGAVGAAVSVLAA